MEDFTIIKTSWLTKVKGNEKRTAAIKIMIKTLLSFLSTNKLLKNKYLSNINTIDDDLEIRKSDLTDEGFEVIKVGLQKWISAIDHGTPPTKYTILKKSLIKVRGHTMKKQAIKPTADPVASYSRKQSGSLPAVCEKLRKEFNAVLGKKNARIYYSMPAWFVGENPVASYRAASKHVLVLFWSGQSFKTKGLTESGKFKAAETRYGDVSEIDVVALRKWLKESKTVIWDYNNLRKKRGKLVRVEL